MNLMLRLDAIIHQSIIKKEILNLHGIVDIFAVAVQPTNINFDELYNNILNGLSDDVQKKVKFFIQIDDLNNNSISSTLDDKGTALQRYIVELDLANNIVEKISFGKLLCDKLIGCAYRCTTIAQTIIASKSGARYVIINLDSIENDQYQMVENICEIYKNYPDLYGEIVVESTFDDLNCIRLGRCGVDVLSVDKLSLI